MYAPRLPLILLLACAAATAQTPVDAARELARRIASLVSKEDVSLEVRNLSSFAPAQAEDARRAVEGELRALGVHVAASGGVAVRVTVSDSLRERLLVAEVPRGDEHQVLIAAWPRETVAAAPPPFWLEKKPVWEQAAPVLDFAVEDALLLVLEPERVAVYERRGGAWEPRHSLAVTAPGPWPRDLRGRLVAQPGTFQAYLPGVTCRGVLAPAPSIACTAGETVWPLYSGATLVARAAFRAGRNFFQGPLTAVSGARINLSPFYSAAVAENTWVTAGPASVWADVAGLEAPCGSGKQMLALRREDGASSVQAFEMTAREPVAAGTAVDFPGTVTALWPAGAASASVVARDRSSGNYVAYSLAVVCGN